MISLSSNHQVFVKWNNSTIVAWFCWLFSPRSTNVLNVFEATPLELNYFKQFSTTRQPRKGMDEVLRFTDQKHIVVICRGHLNALQSSGTKFIHTNLAFVQFSQSALAMYLPMFGVFIVCKMGCTTSYPL